MKRLILPLIVVLGMGIAAAALFSPGPFSRAKKAFEASDYQTAEGQFRRCLEKGKEPYQSLIYLGRIAGIHGRLDEGLGRLDEAIAMHPKRADAYYFKAVLLQLRGEMRDAEKALDEFSNKPQLFKGFFVARVRNPSPGKSRELFPDEKAFRIEILKGTAE